MVKIHLIRHAESEYNALASRIGHELNIDPEMYHLFTYSKVIKDQNIVDAPITAFGIDQCRTLRLNHKDTLDKVKVVLISPMLRTLQTMRHVFDSINTSNNHKFIVHPGIRERWESQCDIPGKTIANRAEFSEADFALMRGLLDKHGHKWFVQALFNPYKRELLESYLVDVDHTDSEAINSKTIDYMRDLLPDYVEDFRDFYQRIFEFKFWLKDFMEQGGYADGEVAIVAHSKALTFLTGSNFGPDCFPKTCVHYKNCDLAEFELEL